MATTEIVGNDVLTTLAAHAGPADAQGVWPEASWQALRSAGVLGWSVPREYGGQDRGPVDLLEGYESLASACLTTCFLLSQREAACRRLRDSSNEALRQELLPYLARGERFATVGLSQLTTSRQHTAPALRAKLSGETLELDGTIPWVTGAERADHLVIGATLDDGRQVLAVLPHDADGVSVGPPLELMALQGALTAEVRCERVLLERRWLLAGPAERVVMTGRGGAGGLETSCLALGLTAAAVSYLFEEARSRPELRPRAEQLDRVRGGLRWTMHELAVAPAPAEKATALRASANSLVLRATQTALTASKGAGFVRSHPAQRWARQALFFLVWSCPRPAAEATLDSLAPSASTESVCEEESPVAGPPTQRPL
jgi:butyryl-CoA dehydrogenase